MIVLFRDVFLESSFHLLGTSGGAEGIGAGGIIISNNK